MTFGLERFVVEMGGLQSPRFMYSKAKEVDARIGSPTGDDDIVLVE